MTQDHEKEAPGRIVKSEPLDCKVEAVKVDGVDEAALVAIATKAMRYGIKESREANATLMVRAVLAALKEKQP